MPEKNTPTGSSPFEIVTTPKAKKGGPKKLIIALVIVLFLVLSVVAGVLLVRQQQNINEKASENLCPAAQACPVAGQPELLRNCNPQAADGSAVEKSCSNINTVGTITTCGTTSYCCPSLGAAWSTNLALCSSPSPTPTATATPSATITPTATGSATPTATATASATPARTATPSAQTTPLPIPVTGISWPTIISGGVGILVIVGSVLLAL